MQEKLGVNWSQMVTIGNFAVRFTANYIKFFARHTVPVYSMQNIYLLDLWIGSLSILSKNASLQGYSVDPSLEAQSTAKIAWISSSVSLGPLWGSGAGSSISMPPHNGHGTTPIPLQRLHRAIPTLKGTPAPPGCSNMAKNDKYVFHAKKMLEAHYSIKHLMCAWLY